MDKNENGYPCRCMSGSADGSAPCQNGTAADMGGNCGGGGCLGEMPLAYVYAPNQTFRMLYTANDAMKHGTLFEELYKPMEVYGRE